MKKSKVLLAVALMGMSTAAMAQATYTDKDGNEYQFKKHAFLDLQGGAQYTLGEAKFGDLISPNVQLGLGYQFSPVFGMRLQANGWQSKGGWAAYRDKIGDEPFSADYKYNSKKADNPNWYFNALASLRINLGKSHTKTEPVKEVPAPRPVEEYVKPEPKPAPVEEKKVEEIRRDVFFVINSNKIRESEDAKIKEVVDYLNQYPEAKVVVTGYADACTGNNSINDRISAKRAAAVVKVLKEKYGIEESRITEDSKGARVQPFSENDKNRVSIMVAK